MCQYRNASMANTEVPESPVTALPPALPDQDLHDSSDAQDPTATPPPESDPIEPNPKPQTEETAKLEDDGKIPPGPEQRGRKKGSRRFVVIEKKLIDYIM
mmetsp:Transcript_431/g.541  ORF Transcript_431/g.541 Transcript_431/m.541 type:complete len:100 (-) Transcript_431:462-761(-)